jgi:integrase
MAVFKRGAVWWYEFTFAGRRVRESAKTTRKTIAVEGEKRRHLELERAGAGMATEEQTVSDRVADVKTLLKEYCDRCEVLAKGQSRSTRTAAFARERSKPLLKHLGARLRIDLTEAAIVEYMKARQGEDAGPRTINMEVESLSRAMGSTWKALWPKLAKLREPRDVGRALTPDEQARILAAAQTSRSRYTQLSILMALQTGMRLAEIIHLTWRDIDLERAALTVPRSSKTQAGARRLVPLTATLRAELPGYREWYVKKLGEPKPDWFVFPFASRVKPIDPTRPTTTLKHGWEAVRTAAGVQCRFHDLRHTAITRMLEAGAPEHAVRAIVGHVSPKMLERYAHMRLEVKRQAIAALEVVGRALDTTGIPTNSPTVGGFSRPN